MSRRNVLIFLVLLYLIITGLYLFYDNAKIDYLVFLLPPLIASIFGFMAAKTYTLKNIHGKSLALIAAGIGFFFIGELLFYIYEYILNKTPFPSPADIFYLLAYPLIFSGLALEVINRRPKLSEFNSFVRVIVFTLLSLLVVIVSYFGIFLAYDQNNSAAANIIAMSYGVGDLILIIPAMFILKLAFEMRGGKLFNAWMYIFFALLLMLGADILFASYNMQYDDGIWPYNLIDLLWAGSYLLFAYAFYYTSSVISESHQKLKSKKKSST